MTTHDNCSSSANISIEDLFKESDDMSPKIDRQIDMTNEIEKAIDPKSRANIALILTRGFISILILIIVGAPVYNLFTEDCKQIDLANLLNTFGSMFGTPLGFVLGYYFKSRKDD